MRLCFNKHKQLPGNTAYTQKAPEKMKGLKNYSTNPSYQCRTQV